MADELPTKRRRLETDRYTPPYDWGDSACSSTGYKILKDFKNSFDGFQFTFSTNDEIVQQCSIKIIILEDEVEDPWSDSASHGLKGWATNECTKCIERQTQSSLAKHMGSVDFSLVKSGTLPSKLPRKVSAFVKAAVHAVKAEYCNGNARDMVHMLLHMAHEHWLCSKHYYTLNIERPGTRFERAGVDVDLDREDGLTFKLRGAPDIAVTSNFCNIVLNIGEMKRMWKTQEMISSIRETLEDSDIGQLLSYMVGHYVKAITSGVSDFVPMLGLFVEGSKVVFVRGSITAVKDKTFKLRLSICPAGEKALDLFNTKGIKIVMSTACRFASGCSVPEEPWSSSSGSSSSSTRSNSPNSDL